MALDGQPAEPFLARDRHARAGAGNPGRRLRRCDSAAGSTSSILLHDGKEARPIARLIVSKRAADPGRAPPAAPPLPSNGLPARLDLKSALRIDLTLARGRSVERRPTG